MKLKTRLFELFKGKYRNVTELARAMGISPSQIYRVKDGKRHINEKFIIGAIKAFPGYKLDDLFYVEGGKCDEFAEFVRRKYPGVDEDTITMMEDILEHKGEVMPMRK